MGRVKLAIKKIETPVGKQVTYSKRRQGLEKKARELATLCDIDIVLILFSPAGKLSWINGSKSPPEEVILRFANLSPQERAKRKLEALEQLKRVFKKLDHEVNVEEYTRMTSQNIEELHKQLEDLRTDYSLLQQRLRSYEVFQTIEQADYLKTSLQERLEKLQLHKKLLESSHQVVPFNQTLGQQLYDEGIYSGVLDASTPATWEAHLQQHSPLALQHESNSTMSQRGSHNTSNYMPGLQASLMSYERQIESSNQGCDSDIFNGLKICQLDESKTEKVGRGLESNCNNAVEYGEDRSNSFRDGDRLSLNWLENANSIGTNGIVNAHQPRYHFLQETPFELADSRPQGNCGVAHSTRESTW